MSPRPAKIDWLKIKLDYVQGSDTLEQIAAKYGRKYDTVAGHSCREKWVEERNAYHNQLTRNLNLLAANKSASNLLHELNEKQLKLSDELRFILHSRLKERDETGKIVPRKNLTVTEVTRAVFAFSELYRVDRIALGVASDNLTPVEQRDRFSEMSETELLSELERVRTQPLIQ